MKALVTGAAGFIGSTLTERLLENGADVVGLDCFTDYYPRAAKERNLSAALSHPRFRFVEAELQTVDLGTLLADRTHVFHLAAQAGVRKSWGRDFDVYTVNNVGATQKLLEACVGLPLERVVYASSSSVYGDSVPMPMREDALPQPVSPYGVTKLAAEQRAICTTSTTTCRPSRSVTSRSTGRGSGLTWASTSFCAPRFGENPSRSMAMASRPATSRLCTMP
jgi:UDP-glucose 4-epimerase